MIATRLVSPAVRARSTPLGARTAVMIAENKHGRKHINSNVCISSGFVKDPVKYSPVEPGRLTRWRAEIKSGAAMGHMWRQNKETFDTAGFVSMAEDMLSELYDAVTDRDQSLLNDLLTDQLAMDLKREMKKGQVKSILPQEIAGFTKPSKLVQFRSFAWGGKDRRFMQIHMQSYCVSVPPNSPLAPGWGQARSDEGIYYFHEASNESTWDRGDALIESEKAFDSVQLVVFEKPIFAVPQASMRWRICGLPSVHEVAPRVVPSPPSGSSAE